MRKIVSLSFGFWALELPSLGEAYSVVGMAKLICFAFCLNSYQKKHPSLRALGP